MIKYRDRGAIGALLDEYEKAVRELQVVIIPVDDSTLSSIADSQTQDPDCVSIQSVLSHVLRAGYNYVVAIRKQLGELLDYFPTPQYTSAAAYNTALSEMFAYNEQLFSDYPNIALEEKESARKILVSWGQRYDVEQLFEHAIVYLLRHRRQIARFLIKLS